MNFKPIAIVKDRRSLALASFCLAAAACAVFSLGHHALNLWGQGWQVQFLALAVSLLLAGGLYGLLKRMPRLPDFPRSRWILFGLASIALASFLTWRWYTPPVSWHRLEIIPGGAVQILEIKMPGPGVIPFDPIDLSPGWVVQDGLLQAAANAEPLQISFRGPSGERGGVLLATGHQTSPAVIRLDGAAQMVDLTSAEPGQRQVELFTRWRGLPNELTLTVIAVIDMIALSLAGLALLWLQARAEQLSLPAWLTIHSHRGPVLILLGLAILLHTLNALAVPLVLDVDSHSYLSGAAHWVQFHTLDGVGAQRGPGSTFLFAPVLLLFGRNPWGLKVLLHLLGVGVVLLVYLLAVQISSNRTLAFIAGLLVAFTPEVYFYSNFVMSDLPNIFFSLVFICLLLAAWRKTEFTAWLLAFLSGSYLILLRPENLVIFAAAAGLAALIPLTALLRKEMPLKLLIRRWSSVVLALAIAILPLLAWSYRNQQQYGFFGLSNYGGATLYDGWIFFGESVNEPITDYESPAMQEIFKSYQDQGQLGQAGPDSFDGDTWNDFYSLTASGYSAEQAHALMMTASLDSLRKDPGKSIQLMLRKFKEGFEPEMMAVKSLALPGEVTAPNPMKTRYFDDETLSIPVLIRLQRGIYTFLDSAYDRFYPAWIGLGICAAALALFRRPFYNWGALAALTLVKIFFPLVIGFGMWRYTVSSVVLLQIFIAALITLLISFGGRHRI